MLVEQIQNKNQFKVFTKNGVVFQSYDSIIAFRNIKNNKVYLTDKWSFSPTTLKHLKLFLRISDNKNQIQKKIDNDIYKLCTEDYILENM